MDAVVSAIPGAVPAGVNGVKHRAKRVRSQVRKRGGRGKGLKKGKKFERSDTAGAGASSHASTANVEGGQESAARTENGSSEKKRKRTRERKNRQWKPWSEQTWQERLARENYEEERAAALEAQALKPESPSSKKKKKRKHNLEIVDIPRAPRNHTQNLIPDDPGEGQDGIRPDQPSSVPSMQGLLSRKMVSFSESRGDDDSSDDEREVNGLPDAVSPHFDSDDDAAPSPACAPEDAQECNGAQEDEKDRKLRELEDENKALRARLAELERAEPKA